MDRYPLLLWGKPGKFASAAGWDGKDGEIMSIKDGRTAERLLDWFNKKMNRYRLFYLMAPDNLEARCFHILSEFV